MLSAVIAEQLRSRGRDVAAVVERRELRGLSDSELLERAQEEQRVTVTYNRDDYLLLDRRWRDEGRGHSGIVILNPRRFPQGSGATGALIGSLDALIAAGAPYSAFVHWLQ